MARLESRVSKLESVQRGSEFAHLSDEEIEQRILELGQRLGLLDEAGRCCPSPATPGDELEDEMRETIELLMSHARLPLTLHEEVPS